MLSHNYEPHRVREYVNFKILHNTRRRGVWKIGIDLYKKDTTITTNSKYGYIIYTTLFGYQKNKILKRARTTFHYKAKLRYPFACYQ